MTKRHDRKVEAERAARLQVWVSSLSTSHGGCQHKLVQTYKTPNYTRWDCTKCFSTMTMTVS